MKNDKKIYVDLHVIQTVPPSCINRDDTGSPKTAFYGGVQRARVSSQSWKKAMRRMFQEEFNENELGIRTKKIVQMVADEMIKIDNSIETEKAMELASKVIKICGISLKDNEAKALFFLSVKQAHNLAELILENDDPSKKEAQSMLTKDHSVDIALFGRMVADNPLLNADACSQVAHSISTHRVDNEYDYFTAVDDLAPEDNAGAGMIGVVEFDSATLYRYATIAVHELVHELGDEQEMTAKAVSEFTKAFITSMPTGKQNTFANRTLPAAVLVTLRSDQPINFVGAFENPIKSKDEGYTAKSVRRLKEYAENIYANFAEEPVKSWSIGMENMGMEVNFTKLLEEVQKEIKSTLSQIE